MVLGNLFGKKSSAEINVVIPDHVRAREEAERQAELKSKRKPGFKLGLSPNPLPPGVPTTFAGPQPRFLVEGLFHIADFCMVKGRVLNGEIFPGFGFEREGKFFAVKEVQRDGRKDKVIIKGDSGAIFLKATDLPMIFNHEILELSPPKTKPAVPRKKKPRTKPKIAFVKLSDGVARAGDSKPADSLVKLETPLPDPDS